MAWNAAAEISKNLAGAVNLRVSGDPGVDIIIWRTSNAPRTVGIQERQRVRGVTQMPASGFLQIVDPEAQISQMVTYRVEYQGHVVATTAPVFVAGMPNGGALLRAINHPALLWSEAIVFEEDGLSHDVLASVHPVLGRRDPIVVSDVLQMESGTLAFLATDIEKADKLLEILQPGEPIVYRTPCTPVTRDKVFVVTGAVKEALVDKKRTLRVITVPFQAVAWPNERPDAPIAPPTWFYSDLDSQTTAPLYSDLRRCCARPTSPWPSRR